MRSSLSELLGNIRPQLSSDQVEGIIAETNVQEATVDREALIRDLGWLGGVLDYMPKKYGSKPLTGITAIESAARKLRSAIKEKGGSFIGPDHSPDEAEYVEDLFARAFDVTEELVIYSDRILRDLATTKYLPVGRPSVLAWLFTPRLSHHQIIAGPMAWIFEKHFKPAKVGFSVPKPGSEDSAPRGPFVRFVQSSVKVLAPAKIRRFTPDTIREAVRKNIQKK